MKVQQLLLIAHALRLKQAHQHHHTNNKNRNNSSNFTNITILNFNNSSNVRPEVRQPLHCTLLRTVEPPVRCGGHHRKIKVSLYAQLLFIIINIKNLYFKFNFKRALQFSCIIKFAFHFINFFFYIEYIETINVIVKDFAINIKLLLKIINISNRMYIIYILSNV